MDITCWGSRGSVPVSGKEYLKYGGDTTCIEITTKTGETVIIDAGTGLRPLGNSLMKRGIHKFHLLLTHAHWDHILGIAFFKPLLFKKVTAVIQDRTFSGLDTRSVFNQVMKHPFFPIGFDDLNADIRFDNTLINQFQVGSIQVETMDASHSGGCLGYKLTEDGKSFILLTDNELGYNHPGCKGESACLKFIENADILFHDGEYTLDEYQRRKTWGHSSVSEVLDFAIKANVKKLGLFHLNQERTDEQVDRMVEGCKNEIKKRQSRMECFAVACNMSMHL